MQPSQNQLSLDDSPLMLQVSVPCDQALTLDMTHLNHESFPPSLYDMRLPTLAVQLPMSSAMPIPKPSSTSALMRCSDMIGGIGDFDPLDLELMAVTSDLGLDDPLSQSFGYDPDFDNLLSPGGYSDNSSHLKDMLSVTKNGLGQDPTLAQLNANELEEPYFDNLEFDLPNLLPEEKSGPLEDFDATKLRWGSSGEKTVNNSSNSNSNSNCGLHSSNSVSLAQDISSSSFPPGTSKELAVAFSTSVPAASSSSSTATTTVEKKTELETLILPSVADKLPSLIPIVKKQSTLHDLLTQHRTSITKSKMSPMFGNENSTSSNSSRLSSSAPTHLSMEQIWKSSLQQKTQGSILSTKSLAEEVPTSAASTSSVSTNEVFSPKDDFDSHDEGFDSELEDSDHYDENSSGGDSTVSDDYDTKRIRSLSGSSSRSSKKERFFWQYNVQAKGPKINRLSLSPCTADPHMLNEITDPVFSPTCYVQGIKHSGKARRGDGNDLTPNPRKLYQIGLELRKLNKVINDLTPVSELPFNARPKSRKEKNKLASRACRLKKKAQHEANKLKLYGLEHEHKKLLTVLKEARHLVAQHLHDPNHPSVPHEDQKLSRELDEIINTRSKAKVAGQTTDFVNEVIDSIAAGKPVTALENL